MTTRDELVANAITLLQNILDHKKKHWRRWERQFYPISNGLACIRLGTPDLRSPEVQLLLECGLVSFVGTCQNPDIPEDSLRLLDQDEAKAKSVIAQYVICLSQANKSSFPELTMQVKQTYSADLPVPGPSFPKERNN